MIRTVLCARLGIDLPIVQAPIGGATCPELAAAVSNSGALGMLSVTWRTPAQIVEVLRATRALTPRPFGVNLVVENDVHDKLKACLDEGAKIVSLFWGAPDRYVEAAHEAGALVMHSVGSVQEARDAVSAGADVLVAQGVEAGGHVCGTTSTMTLVPAVVDAVGEIPVIAAGGIGDGRGIAAVLALGAQAAWLGTRFVASEEALAHRLYKEKLVAATSDDTVHSSLFDIGWENAPHRTLRNTTVEAWERAGAPPSGERPGEGETVAYRADGTSIPRYSVNMPVESMTGDLEALALYAGQGVGLVQGVQPAADIVRELARETEQVFERLAI